MARKKYINADEALGAGLKVEVAPYDQKEVVADKDGKFLGQNGTTIGDLNMVGTGEYINATNYDKMSPGYAIVTNPYQAASPDQIAQRQQAAQKSTGTNDMTLMGDDAYNQILQYQQAYANAQTDAERAAAHAAAEAIRAQYGYSGGVDGSEHLGLMVNTEGLYDDEDDYDYEDERGGSGSMGGASGGFSYEDAPQYLSRWQERIDALADAILNRPAFSYDPETDPTYQQYKAGYTRDGKRAMQDTLAQVSARTGGMASSYGVGASQQTFNNYMAQLADKIPELKQLAYSMYMDDLAQDRNDLSMLMGLEQSDYGKYLDQLGQWNTDRNFDYGVHRDDVADSQWQQQFDYGVSRDQVADSQWQQSFDYQKEQDKLAQQNWQTQWDYQLEQDALARQDALNKLLSGGGGSTPAAKPDIMGALSGMSEDEAQLYLIMEGYSQNERETIMEIFRNSNAQPEETGPIDNTEGLALLRELERDGATVQQLRAALTDLYENGLITEEAYLRRQDRYR